MNTISIKKKNANKEREKMEQHNGDNNFGWKAPIARAVLTERVDQQRLGARYPGEGIGLHPEAASVGNLPANPTSNWLCAHRLPILAEPLIQTNSSSVDIMLRAHYELVMERCQIPAPPWSMSSWSWPWHQKHTSQELATVGA